MGALLDWVNQWVINSKRETFRTEAPRAKWTSAGGVVLAGLDPWSVNYLYVRKPANNWGPWTFAKGKVDPEESREVAALREVQEEMGLRARFLPKPYLGVFSGGFSETHFYMMVRTGGTPNHHDFETEEVRCVSFSEAFELLKGNARDLRVLEMAEAYVSGLRARGIGGV